MGKYTIDKKKYKEYIKYALETGFDDEESAKEQLSYVVNKLNNLSDPVKLYRLIFLDDPSSFDKNQPGVHYVINVKKLIRDHYDEMLYNYSKFDESKPYILTIESPKSKIDFDTTIKNNLAYPHEEEISLLNAGQGTKIISLNLFNR